MKKILFFALALWFTSGTVSHAQPYTIQQYLNIKSATAPAFSPDGERVAYLTNVSGTNQVWTVDLKGGKPRQLTN
jgi:Tol biopolymer transport system component